MVAVGRPPADSMAPEQAVDPALAARLREVLDLALTRYRFVGALDGDGVWTQRHGDAGIDNHGRLQHLVSARCRG